MSAGDDDSVPKPASSASPMSAASLFASDPEVVVAAYNTLLEAELARGRLESDGVRARIRDGNTVGIAQHLALAVGGAKVVVAQSDVEAARAILALVDDGSASEAVERDIADADTAKLPLADGADIHSEQTADLLASVDDVSVPRLLIVSTALAGTPLFVRAPLSVIGRTADNDFTIEHRSISRNHAQLLRVGESGVSIVDLDSANGVVVNNREVRREAGPVTLQSGDIVELGKVRMRFVAVGEPCALTEGERAAVAREPGERPLRPGERDVVEIVRHRRPPSADQLAVSAARWAALGLVCPPLAPATAVPLYRALSRRDELSERGRRWLIGAVVVDTVAVGALGVLLAVLL